MAVETLRPNAAGDSAQHTVNGTTFNYVAVSDDLDTTYLRNNTGGNREDDLHLGAPVSIVAGNTINSIDVRFRARTETLAGAMVQVGLRLGGTNSLATSQGSIPTSATDYTRTSIARPGGGAWTFADLANLQVVVVSNNLPSAGAIRIFELWVDVNYETHVPIGPVTDSGAGTDTPTVAKTELRSVADTGAGTQAVTTFVDYPSNVDSGTGTEAIAIEVLVDVPVADSGTGTETITVADFVAKNPTEAGVGTETISVVQTNFVQLADSGVGTDTRSLLQARQIADAGTGTDVIAGQGDHPLTDSGVGSDSIRVTVIPFTQILPLVEGTIYDLVVVARIQQASGPPTFIEIDPIEWKSLSYSNTLSQPQELTASCLISSVTESVLQRLRRLHELATELWLYRDGELVFAGPLQGWQTSGEDLTIRCKGLLAYLRGMVVNSDLRFKNVDQFTIVKTMVDQWQALEYGHFGIDTSAVGTSGQLRTEDFLKIELHNIGQRVEELGKLANGFDSEIDPASRRLQLWTPRKGVDRSSGEDAIVFDARNITSGDILCSVAGGDLASEAFGTSGSASGDDAKISTASNTELRARYGRTAVTQTWSDVKDQVTLDLYTQALLEARAEVLMVPGPRCRVTPDADLTDYDVGDNIAYDLASQLGITGAFRIRKQTVTVSSTGQESVNLEFV